ncbi:MAG: trypsin-like serine protease [Anaerolineae bacterium]|nr:trypsin-like serine protease [Anaerolineae bacterium]
MKRTVLTVTFILVMMLGAVGVAQAIINGQPDDNRHPYVGMLLMQTDDGGFEVCSGAAISKKVILTSAHCFSALDKPVFVTFDADANPESNPKFHSGSWFPHPDFCADCSGPQFNSYDVAVVILDKSVKLPRYAVLPSEGLVDTLDMKTKLGIVGYGVQEFVIGDGPPTRGSAFTRFFSTVDLIKNEEANSDAFIKISANPAKEKGSVCYIDSGGPDLLEDTDTVLAVNSYANDNYCKSVSYSYRVDTPEALKFIEQFLKKK